MLIKKSGVPATYARRTQTGDADFGQGAVSESAFPETGGGTGGAVLGADLWMPKPIPFGGISGTDFRVFPIGPGVAPNIEMASITDFNGVLGAVDVRGMATNQNTGERLLFDSDMRFMDGVYIGTDGQTHEGTFGFVSIRLYRGQYDFTTQIHDFDPGITPYPSGVFWTVPIPASSLEVNSGAGRASYHVSDLPVRDYHNLIVAVTQPDAFEPATVSFDVEWHGVAQRVKIGDPDLRYTTDVVVNETATMAWSATSDGVTCISDAAGTSHSVFAQMGHERNGAFFS